MSELLNTAAVLGGASGLRAVATAIDTVAYNHRGKAHRAIEFSSAASKLFEMEQRASSITPEEWAADHRMCHHQFPDVDLYPFWKIAGAIDSNQISFTEVPDEIAGLDDFVDAFPLDVVMEIGRMAGEYLEEEVFLEHYKPPSFESRAEIERLLFDPTPKYYYESKFFDRKRVFSHDESAHILLRDQHSPALAPPRPDGSRNPVMYVWLHDTKLNRVPTQQFRQNPHTMPEDLRPKAGENVKKSNARYVKKGFLAAGIMAFLIMGDYSMEGAIEAAAAGSFVNGFGLGILERGSATVNAFGHMGVMTPETIRSALRKKNFIITPNPNGTLASDTNDGGIIGKVMSIGTGEESGRQSGHHLDPAAIAYPDKDGAVSWSSAPTGRSLEWAADNPYIKFVTRGPGLRLNKYGRRPDEQHPAVDLVQQERVRTMNQKDPLAA